MDFSGFQSAGTVRCASCSSALAPDQRYCLQCGARNGAPRVDPLAELGLVGLAPFGVQEATEVAAAAPSRARVSRPLAVVLATLALTVGGALGATIHGPATSLAAATPAASPIVLVSAGTPIAAAPAPADDTSGGSDTSGLADDGGDGDLLAATPDVAAAPTPAPAAAPTPTPTPAPTSTGTPTSGSPTPAGATPTPTAVAPEPTLPTVGHVWVVDLTGQDASVFSDTTNAPYLAGTLVPQGTLLTNYSAVGTGQLANGVALLSGQAPNSATQADCPTPTDVTPGVLDPKTGLVSGTGCFYGADVPTLPSQLTQAGKTWKAYLGALPNPCGQPAPDPALPGYVPQRNAFAAFHGLADPTGAGCVPNEVGLDALAGDLADPPALSWIVPSSCDSGAPEPCTEGAPAGAAALDGFLARTIPAIQASPAYAKDGLIVITFDVGPQPAAGAASTQPAPVGALLVGPGVRTATKVATKADHYALLRTLQKLFSLTPTGHAADAETFGADVWASTTTRP